MLSYELQKLKPLQFNKTAKVIYTSYKILTQGRAIYIYIYIVRHIEQTHKRGVETEGNWKEWPKKGEAKCCCLRLKQMPSAEKRWSFMWYIWNLGYIQVCKCAPMTWGPKVYQKIDVYMCRTGCAAMIKHAQIKCSLKVKVILFTQVTTVEDRVK